MMDKRLCGECTLCCTAVAVTELAKPTGIACSHCSTRCDIYDTRPLECRTFNCLWLEGQFSDADRPDDLGVVFFNDRNPSTGERMVCISEGYEGAAETPRVQALLIEILAADVPVVIRNQHRVIKLHPDGTREQAAIEQSDPLKMQIDPTTHEVISLRVKRALA